MLCSQVVSVIARLKHFSMIVKDIFQKKGKNEAISFSFYSVFVKPVADQWQSYSGSSLDTNL